LVVLEYFPASLSVLE